MASELAIGSDFKHGIRFNRVAYQIPNLPTYTYWQPNHPPSCLSAGARSKSAAVLHSTITVQQRKPPPHPVPSLGVESPSLLQKPLQASWVVSVQSDILCLPLTHSWECQYPYCLQSRLPSWTKTATGICRAVVVVVWALSKSYKFRWL